MRTVIKRMLIYSLIAIMIILYSPAYAEETTGIVTGGDLNVYRDPYLTKFWGTVEVNTEVTINMTIGGVSQITLNGKTGYCESDAVVEKQEAMPETTVTKTTRATRVYRSPNLRSQYVNVPAGTELEVIAIQGSCAKVRKGSKIGYTYAGHLAAYAEQGNKTEPEQAENPLDQIDPSGVNSLSSMISSGKYTNEQIIFAFAVKSMGYNAAAASALLANIQAESGFKTTIVGDSGTSYGLCQWHASRKTRLINYCTNNGYDYTTLEGQLYYLKYELEKYYPSVNKYMLSVSDDADGAYDAGYYFCYNFEAPANRVARSKTRGTTAQTKFYPKYKSYTI